MTFTSLEDFCRRQDLHTVNKRVLESLVKAGALDAFGGRQALLASLDNALTAAQRDKQAAEAGQFGMFDAFGIDAAAPPLAFAASVIAVRRRRGQAPARGVGEGGARLQLRRPPVPRARRSG